MDKGTAREVFLHNFRRLIAFDNRPDVQELLRKGAYQTEGGILIGKKLDDLSPFAKGHIRNTLLLVLKSEGLIA